MSVPIEFRAPEAAIAGATATMTVAGSDHVDLDPGYRDLTWYRFVATDSSTKDVSRYIFGYWELTIRHTVSYSDGDTYTTERTEIVSGREWTSSKWDVGRGCEEEEEYETDYGTTVRNSYKIIRVVAVYYYFHKATMRILCDKDSREILAAERPSGRIGRIYFDGGDYTLDYGEPGPDDDDLGDETE